MESKDQVIHDEYEKPQPHPPTGIVNAAHLYQEDSEGRVIARLLLPRPTDNPKDPLTWSLWRKHLAMATICFFVFLSNYITSSISPILVNIVVDFDISLTRASWLITFNILFLGIGNLLWIPLSNKIGKRPVLLLCSGIFFVSSIWSAVARDWSSLFGARIIQGFGASSSEALGPAVVADLYFLHQRGLWVGVYTFMIACGAALGGVFAGFIADANPDWRWVFWMNVILTGVCFLATILFQSETNFKRPAECETGEGLDPSELGIIQARANSSWVNSLGVASWYNREVSIWWLLWRPWLTLQYPAVVWGSLTYGVCLGWVVFQQTANAGVYPELYNYSALAVGNINISYTIGAIVGSAAGGPVSDWVVGIITKRRGGYFVPEFRLWCLLLPFVFGPIGLMLWGGGLENHLTPMIGIAGSGISYGVLCAASAVAMAYVVDSYRPLAGETMTILTAFKNTFAFGLSFAVFPWLQRDGFVKVSGWMLLIEGLIFLLTIPMYTYGERLRQQSAKFVI